MKDHDASIKMFTMKEIFCSTTSHLRSFRIFFHVLKLSTAIQRWSVFDFITTTWLSKNILMEVHGRCKFLFCFDEKYFCCKWKKMNHFFIFSWWKGLMKPNQSEILSWCVVYKGLLSEQDYDLKPLSSVSQWHPNGLDQ